MSVLKFIVDSVAIAKNKSRRSLESVCAHHQIHQRKNQVRQVGFLYFMRPKYRGRRTIPGLWLSSSMIRTRLKEEIV